MPGSAEKPVAIVGGGIAGLALGRALQGAQMPFVILERSVAAADAGLAIVLPGNAIAALGTLGLREPIEQLGYPFGRREYRTAGDKLLCEIDEDGFWGPTRRPRTIKRSALLAMLAEGLPGGAVRRETELRVAEIGAECTTLRLANGESLDTSLLVGADGVNSTVRKQMFTAAAAVKPALLAQASWRFMAPNPGVDCWTLWAGAEGMVLLVPVSRDEVYGWAAMTRPQPDVSSNKSLTRLIQNFPTRVQQAVTYAISGQGRLHWSPLEQVTLDLWHQGRAVLIGDAAHALAPVWAQGAALSMEDAIILARSLGRHAGVAAALSAYEAERRPRVEHVQRMTDAMSKAGKLPPFVRNILLPMIGPKRYRQTYEPLKVSIA
ncbi:FAD-dependent monooxygenase [Sphingomonas sp. ASY06-1R]|uniref:FAD-dependent monooxygenase n=1 Tax=Sphingomonas sp. ASY06-1R TaxID=3445771 RepID=UPI003FA32272